MNNPLISVVMSAYNAEKFIAQAIQSILDQTYTHFEFIIINDGSTDKTRQIIKGFTDNRIVFIDKQQNTGLSSALNDGIDAAKGAYIARMDADDESLPERFKLQIEFMEKHPDIGVLGTAMTIFLVDEVTNERVKVEPEPPKKSNPILNDFNGLFGNRFISHPTAMIRKTALNNTRYNEKYFTEDYKLWVDLAKKGVKFANLETPLLNYNRHKNTISYAKKNEQKESANLIKMEYTQYYLGQSIADAYKEELRWLFGYSKNKILLGNINCLYKRISKENPQKAILMRRLFRKGIRSNINLLHYNPTQKIKPILLGYYFKYKARALLNNWFCG